jgi:hypothetical protein
MQAGLAYSVQQLGCRLKIGGLVNQFLVGAGVFFWGGGGEISSLVVGPTQPPVIVGARSASAGSEVARA